MTLLPDQRTIFEVPEDVCYLNTSYMAPQLRTVRDAGKAAIDWRSRPWEITAEDFFRDVEQLRAQFAALIGTTPDCVALVPAASYGIATAAGTLPFQRGQAVLLLEGEYPSNFYAWQRLAEEQGGRLIRIERPPDGDWTSAVLERLDSSVRIASLPHCYWVYGSCLDLEKIGAACRAAGTALVLDLTQSCGAMSLDIEAVDPDFAVVAGYKWLLCPYQSSFLYIAPRHHQGRPLEESWAGRAGAEDFSQLVPYKDAYQAGARRYDVGERSNFTLVAQALVALRQLNEWSVARVAETLARKTLEIREGCSRLGLVPPPSPLPSPHIVGFRLPSTAPADLVARLASDRVHASVRGEWLRLSPHLHVSSRDLERLSASLSRHLQAK